MDARSTSLLSPARRDLLLGSAGALAFAMPTAAARADSSNLFALGVASGQPRPNGIVLWTRLMVEPSLGPVRVRWEVAADEAFRTVVANGTEIAIARDGFCVHAEPSGLESGRPYWYRFDALGILSPTGRTRTAPAAGDLAPLRLAIASCQRFDTGHYAAWASVAERPLDLVVFLGDYIYEYATRAGAVREVGPSVATLDDFRARYAVHRSDPALQAAHAAHPWLVIWDDHEVDNDYAGITGQSLQPDFARYRADAYQAWWEHMPVPKAWRPRDGVLRIYDRFDWGRLARIHLLDTRQYRDIQACPRPGRAGSNSVTLADCPALSDPNRSLLGERQERWLAAGLASHHRWNLIAQSTLMAKAASGPPGSERHWTDGWDGYPAARRRLLESLTGRPGPLVLGGDIHTHVAADLRLDFEDPATPVVASEFCCTSISSLGPPQSRVDASRAANPHIRYARSDRRGYIEIAINSTLTCADLVTVDDPIDPKSACQTSARFVVDAERPGVQPA